MRKRSRRDGVSSININPTKSEIINVLQNSPAVIDTLVLLKNYVLICCLRGILVIKSLNKTHLISDHRLPNALHLQCKYNTS